MREEKYYCDICKNEHHYSELYNMEFKLTEQNKKGSRDSHCGYWIPRIIETKLHICKDCMDNKLKIKSAPKDISETTREETKKQRIKEYKIERIMNLLSELGLELK